MYVLCKCILQSIRDKTFNNIFIHLLVRKIYFQGKTV